MTTTHTATTADTMPGRRRRGMLPTGAALVGGALLIAWAGASGYRQDLIVLVAVYALIALGMYIPFVMAGSLSMAYSAYAAIGGYAVAIITTKTELPAIVGWVLGPIVSALVAVVLSLLTRRLSGFYLAAATLLFGMAFEPWLVEAKDLTGGSAGIGSIPAPELFGWEPPRLVQAAGALLLVVIVATLIERVRTGSWGVMIRALRDVPSAVEASGVRTATMTTVALAVGAAVASLGGALFASFVLSITPETFTLAIVFMAIFIPLIGGQGSAWGSVIGAVLVVQLTVNMPEFEASGQLLLAVAVLLVLLLAPSGIIGYAQKLVHAVRNRMGRKHDDR